MHVSQSELRLPIRTVLLGLGVLGAALVAGTGGYLLKAASPTPISVAPASISVPAAMPVSAISALASPTQSDMTDLPGSGGSFVGTTTPVEAGPVLATDQPTAIEEAAPAVEVPAAGQPAEVAEPAPVAAAPADDQPEPGDVPDGE